MMARGPLAPRQRADATAFIPFKRLALLGVVLIALAGAACYDNNTGETNIGGSINFTLPTFQETGANSVQIFTEMHYQPSYKSQEGPRLLPPSDSVPVTGREMRYATLEDYSQLTNPVQDPGKGEELFEVNCAVCHGTSLKGDGPIRPFMARGPFPADLTLPATKSATDGEVFAFISRGGRQGFAAIIRGLKSASPMPEFGLLLTEEERWTLVLYLRSRIGR